MESFDVVVIGGGIAGVSIGHHLAADRAVCLLEGERSLAAHTTGRSAATWIGSYGPPRVRAWTQQSRPFIDDPPLQVDGPLLTPLPCLYVGAAGSADAVRALASETEAELLTAEEAEQLNPALRPGHTELAALDATAMELDVHGLHQGYLRGLRARGGVVHTSSLVTGASRVDGQWVIRSSSGTEVTAPLVVNAAGAWGDQVGSLFGSSGVGLTPRRRTMFASPTSVPVRGLPFTCDIDDGWYFKPEGDTVLCSPQEATAHEPGDPKPDELEIARTIEEINDATTLELRSVRTAWAGLRTFAPDGEPVVRHDDTIDGLFWFVGQGGYGIQMAPALAAYGASAVNRRDR